MIGNHLEPFKFWCQKVLPNVYDDSLSYYEYLCKLNEYLNEVIEQINTLTDNMSDYETDLTAQWTTYRDELSAQWQTYKTYIDTYFNNLDVQQEINNKLDAMATDGTLSALIAPFIGNDIQSTVTSWLSEHVEPVGSAVIVDNTLSVSGAAADSAKTGALIAHYYDNTATYPLDSYCLYNGGLYRCISAITTAEEWTSGHWTLINTALEMSRFISPSNIFVNTSQLASVYNDVNKFPLYKVVGVAKSYTSSVAHSPYSGIGYFVISMLYARTNIISEAAGEMQIAIPFANSTNQQIKTRTYDGTNWTEWNDQDDKKAIKSSNIFVTDATSFSQYSDVDNLPVNTVALINSTYAPQMGHSPYDDVAYNVITSSYLYANKTSYGGEFQLAIPFDTNKYTIKYRSYSASWTAWRSVNETLEQNAIKSSEIYVTSSNISTYPTMGSLPMNSVALVNKNCGAPDVPFNDSDCTIITTSYHYYQNIATGGTIQIAIPFNTVAHNIKTRGYNGVSWTEWKEQGNTVFKADNTNFIEVIDKAIKVDNAIVYLSGGTYTMFDATHDETYWKNRRPQTRYCGLLLNNRITLVGLGEVTINANYTGSDEDIKENFSIFNICGNFKMRNLNLVGENICYIVHDDQGINNHYSSEGEYDTIKMTHNGSDHTFTSGAPTCIGGGCSANYTKRTIKNCVFDAQEYKYPVSYHTLPNYKGDVVIKDNYFKNGGVRFWQYMGGTLTGMVTNNSVKTATVATDAGLTLYDWNNEIRT